MQARLVAHVGWLAAVLCLASCKDLTLPAPPDPTRPGTLSGRLVAALPGQLGLKAVAHARVQLLQADLTTFTDDHGYFLLGGVLVDAGDVLCSVDLDGDGQPDLQRLLTLQALHGRKGVDVSVGDLQLVQNATVRGKLRLGDVASTGGHAGTRVFLVDGPAVAITSDDGSFLLPRLPEGSVTLGFTHAGYQGGTFPGLDLVGGQDLALLPRDLEPDVTPSASVGLVGRALTPDGGAALDADVALHGNGVLLTAPVQADGGAFAFAQVPPGLYTLTAARPGAVTVVLPNLLLLTGTRDMHALVLLDLPPTPDGGVVDAGTPPPPPSGGQTPRVRVVPFAAGAQPGCGNAGYVLQSGLDLNGNGVLDPAEVTSRQVVCLAALVNLTPASRLACPEGGWILTTWVDASLDGVFQPGEAVGAPTYLCNAPPALVACQAPTLRSVDTGAYPWPLPPLTSTATAARSSSAPTAAAAGPSTGASPTAATAARTTPSPAAPRDSRWLTSTSTGGPTSPSSPTTPSSPS